MDPSRIAVFDLAERRLAWVARRQELLVQNIANADTPGWRSRDLKPFAAELAGRAGLAPAQTNPMHLRTPSSGQRQGQPQTGENAPDGNAVALDVELSKVADTESVHSLATGIYSKYLGLFRIAAGR